MVPTRPLTPLSRGRRLPRGRHSLSREEVSASQRGRLIVAMAEEVAEQGYANTAIADISARAGVSTKTFYEYFSGKEDCFLAAHAECVDALVHTMGSALGDRDGDGQTAPFSRVLSAYLETLAAEPALARTFLIEVYAAGPRALEQRAAAQRRFARLLARSLGLDRKEADVDCEALVGTISSLVTTQVSLGEHEQLPRLHGRIIRFVERQLGTTV